MCEGSRIREIVYGDEVNVRITDGSAKDIASDAPKAVYANLNRHCKKALLRIISARVFVHLSRQGTHFAQLIAQVRIRNVLGIKEAQDYAAWLWSVKLASHESFGLLHVLDTHDLQADSPPRSGRSF